MSGENSIYRAGNEYIVENIRMGNDWTLGNRFISLRISDVISGRISEVINQFK